MAQWKIVVTIFLVLASTILAEAALERKHSKHNGTRRGHHHHHKGKQWAVLVAGSYDYSNYRHQADVCHAYQILKKGGLKDENIIVFMYDDIAFNEENPRKGVIINKPDGPNVYEGVPKDYTGENVTVENFFNVLLANKSGLTGGSGKVLDSGPNDHIFIYYSDHGAPGLVEMPNGIMFAKDFIDVLKKKHEARSYAQMVIYMEACYAGTMFEGLLPEDWNIYATTASNATELSYACYCIEKGEYNNTCLGDCYSVSWLEDSETHNLSKETLHEQFQVVKNKTVDSHVTEFGNKSLAASSFVSEFLVSKSREKNATIIIESQKVNDSSSSQSYLKLSQHDVELHRYRQQYAIAAEGSDDARKKLDIETQRRGAIDGKVNGIAAALLGSEKRSSMLKSVRTDGNAVVDDWDCLKSMLRIYEEQCGKLTSYGLKYTGLFANMCNAGVGENEMASVSAQICSGSRA
ncbi:hypothetical protein QQ045_016774 [Rhodiola kirilowii]